MSQLPIGVHSMTTLTADLRYGLRMLRRSPGFTTVAVLTLALGIGASTAIFSLIDAVMLRTLPVRDPSRLVVLSWAAHKEPRRNGTSSFGDCGRDEGGDRNPTGCSFPEPYYELVRSEKEVFSGATAIAGPAHLVLTGNGAARMARGEIVSGDYFSTLGVGAALGRTLGPDDDTVAAAPAAVLSYAFWQTAFGGDRSAVGRAISLNSVPFTIVGVADPKFTNLSPGKTQDLFFPVSMVERLNIGWGTHTRSLDNWWLVILARLKPGVTLEKAQASASLTFRDEMLHGAKPLSKPEDNPAIVLSPAQTGLSGERRFFSKPLYVLMAGRRSAASDRLRQCRRTAARARHDAAEGNGRAPGGGRGPRPNCAPVAHGKRRTLTLRRHPGCALRVLGCARHDGNDPG